MRLRLFAAAALFAGSLFAADPDLLSLAMPDSQLLAGVNADRAVLSPLGQFFLAQFEKTPDMQKLAETAGFDPRHDVREILVSAKGLPNQPTFVVMARGAFDPSKIQASAVSDGATVDAYKGVTVIQIEKDKAMAFPDATLAILGEPADVRAAIDRKTTPASLGSTLAAEVARVSASEDAWFVSILPLSQLQQPGAGPNPMSLYSKVQQASGGVTFGANLVASLQMVSETAQDASALATLLKMAVGAMAASPNNAQVAQTAELLKAMNITTDGALTKISWSMPEPQLEQMFQTARAATENSKRNATAPQAHRLETHNPPPADAVAGRLHVNANVQEAKLLQQPAPEYPPLAKQARISGVVRLNAIIGKDGTVENLTLLSGHPLLVQAAMQAVKQWVYQPTMVDGKAVSVITQVEVNFTLEP